MKVKKNAKDKENRKIRCKVTGKQEACTGKRQVRNAKNQKV